MSQNETGKLYILLNIFELSADKKSMKQIFFVFIVSFYLVYSSKALSNPSASQPSSVFPVESSAESVVSCHFDSGCLEGQFCSNGQCVTPTRPVNSRLRNCRTKNAKLLEQINNLREERHSLERNYANLKSEVSCQIEKLKQSIANQRKENTRLQASLKDLKTHHVSLIKQNKVLEINHELARNKCDISEDPPVSPGRVLAGGFGGSVDFLDNTCPSAGGGGGQTDRRSYSIETDSVSACRRRTEGFKIEIEGLEKAVQNGAQKYAQLKASLIGQKEKLKKKLADVNKINNGLKASIDRVSTENKMLVSQTKNLERYIASLAKDCTYGNAEDGPSHGSSDFIVGDSDGIGSGDGGEAFASGGGTGSDGGDDPFAIGGSDFGSTGGGGSADGGGTGASGAGAVQ